MQTARRNFSLWSWFKPTKIVYPPTSVSTSNKIYPYYFNNNEFESLTITRTPVLLNFTKMGSPGFNELNEKLFDIIANKDTYPLGDFQVNLINLDCSNYFDTNDLLQKYGVSHLPTIVRLHNTLVVDKLELKPQDSSQEIILWLQTINAK